MKRSIKECHGAEKKSFKRSITCLGINTEDGGFSNKSGQHNLLEMEKKRMSLWVYISMRNNYVCCPYFDNWIGLYFVKLKANCSFWIKPCFYYNGWQKAKENKLLFGTILKLINRDIILQLSSCYNVLVKKNKTLVCVTVFFLTTSINIEVW